MTQRIIRKALNLPLRSYVHTRALLASLVMLSSRTAPPGAQTSLMGLVSIPFSYFPYVMVAMDFALGGTAAAAQAVTGLIVGHLWWWGVFETQTLKELGKAPGWMSWFVGGPEGGSSASGGVGGTGVHVIPPRQRQQPATASSSGYSWGRGQRLGDS
jgi:Derlin-2/3